MNLASIIEHHPADHPALISRGQVTDYGTLRDQVANLRGGYVGLGIEPGDRVAILCANNWYFVVNYLAILGVGGVAVPLNPLSPPKELERELAAVGARALVVGPSARDTAANVDLAKLPVLEFVVQSKGADAEGVALDDLLAAEPTPIVDREAEDLAVLIFTSGTAGFPKAAMLSHGNLLTNIDQVLKLAGDGRGDPTTSPSACCRCSTSSASTWCSARRSPPVPRCCWSSGSIRCRPSRRSRSTR